MIPCYFFVPKDPYLLVYALIAMPSPLQMAEPSQIEGVDIVKN